MLDGIPLFKGEVFLLSWGETSSRGKTVTFALDVDSAPDGHPFKGLGTGKHGQKFVIVAVPVTDSGTPLSPETAQEGLSSDSVQTGSRNVTAPVSGEAKERRRFSELPLPQQVALRCAEAAFQKWAGLDGEDVLAAWVRFNCDVKTRKEILPGTEAAKKWLALETRYLSETGQMAEAR